MVFDKTKEAVVSQNRIWVRISSACNNNCIFCLDSNSKKGIFVDDKIVKKQIKDGFKEGYFNKIIISGGEASINPEFINYIKYAKKVGYDKIQTITNGQKFADLDFCTEVVKAGLSEVTFSIHGHNDKIHDLLSGKKGAFRNAVTGLLNFKKYFPEIILNADIVVNKINVKYLPQIINFFIKLGIYEFDILQLIPFGSAVKNRDLLYYKPEDYNEQLSKTWEISKNPGIVMWTNRFRAEFLEGYENLIQDPKKIKSEVMEEGFDVYNNFIVNGIKPNCFGINCDFCFLKNYCVDFISTKGKNLKEGKKLIINNIDFKKKIGSKDIKYFVLKGEDSVSDVIKKFGENKKDFLEKVKKIKLDKNQFFVNIPACITQKKEFIFEDYLDLKEQKTLKDYTEKFISDLYRAKSLRCKECKYFNKCDGLHINFIRAYGFSILKPIPGSKNT